MVKAVFVDIETNGLCPISNVVMDVSVVIVDLNDYSNATAYTACIQLSALEWINSDPEALSINGFTPQNHDPLCQSWFQVERDLEKFLIKNGIKCGQAVFICQNPGFDKPFFHQIISERRMKALKMPYHWLDLASMYWMKYYGGCSPMSEFACHIDLSKDAIAKHLGLEPEEKPHRSLSGALHLMNCFKLLMCEPRNCK